MLQSLSEPDFDDQLSCHAKASGFTIELLDHPEGEINIDALLLQAGPRSGVEIECAEHGVTSIAEAGSG